MPLGVHIFFTTFKGLMQAILCNQFAVNTVGSSIQNLMFTVLQTHYIYSDLIPFLLGAGLLTLYLALSAATEMGTKLPWKK